MITRQDFLNDPQGRKFIGVVNDERVDFQEAIDFFNDPQRQQRLEDSEEHHDRAPLAGVIKEFEELKNIDHFFTSYDAHTTGRFRQAIGVLVKMHMERLGWRTTGRKGSLGIRVKTPPRTKTPGAYYNKPGSISRWFTRAERYEKPKKK